MKCELRLAARYSADNDVTLVTGNCLALLKQIPDRSARLVVTSPPYNLNKSYERKQSLDEYLAFQRRVIAECVRVLRPGGSICWQVGNHVGTHGQIVPLDILLHPLFAKYETSHKLRLRNRIIWHFEHGLHCRRRFSGRHETILWYTQGDRYRFDLDALRVPQKYPGKRSYQGPNRGKFSGNPLGKNPSDVWIFPNVKGNHVEKTSHPCQFPIELVTRLIAAFTKPGELVIDPFIGVGTTAAAAVIMGRKVAGADVVRDYIAIARERVRKAETGSLRYRKPGTPVHTPRPNTTLTTRPEHFRAPGVRSLALHSPNDL
jgi:adenine-specific DNA-methyltransferase